MTPLWSPKQRENGAPAKTFSYVPNWKLQFLVMLEFEYFDRMWKAHKYILLNFGPTLKKTWWGSSLNTVTVYLQLWASLKTMVFSGVQTWILCDKIWKEHILSSALGPTKNINF